MNSIIDGEIQQEHRGRNITVQDVASLFIKEDTRSKDLRSQVQPQHLQSEELIRTHNREEETDLLGSLDFLPPSCGASTFRNLNSAKLACSSKNDHSRDSSSALSPLSPFRDASDGLRSLGRLSSDSTVSGLSADASGRHSSHLKAQRASVRTREGALSDISSLDGMDGAEDGNHGAD